MTVDEFNQRLEAEVSATIRVMVDLYADELQQLKRERKKGKWMPHIVEGKHPCESIDHDVCSVCHTCHYGEPIWDWKYCPVCGAEMEAEKRIDCSTCKYQYRNPRECGCSEKYENWEELEVDG